MAIVNKQQLAIHDAIDPKGAQIRELQKELKGRDARIERLNKNLHKADEDTRKLHWLKEHGVMIETPDGMRYLKDEEFTEFLSSVVLPFSSFYDTPVKAEGSAVSY